MSKLLTGFVLLTTLSLYYFTTSLHAVPFESKRFIPYFNMGISQGAYLPSKGDFFTGANMGMSVGLLTKFTENHSAFSLYNLNFSGEAFRFQDTQEFASKDLAHTFNFEYRWQINDALRVRPGVSYGMHLTRTAANEIWGQGLYDSKSLGGQFFLDFMFGPVEERGILTFQGIYRDVKFPNYTDIIREFQGLNTNTELAGGLKDQILNEVGVSFNWNKIFSHIRYNWIKFKNEKVVEPNGVYGATAQKDTNLSFNGGFNTRLWIFELSPELGLTKHQSNQNFLLFQSVTDASPLFSANYYNYMEYSVSVPLSIHLTKKWALYGGADYRRRNYSDRQARNSSNQFIAGEKQSNNLASLSVGFKKKMNEISAMTLTYSSVVATSNNKFERYQPYNYTGQKIAIAYQITY